MNLIENAFFKEGYISISFSFNGAGHPMIEAKLAGNVSASFLLDTGASANLLDYGFAEELGLAQVPTGEKGGGAGGLTYDVFSIGKLPLEISGQSFWVDNFLSMDFSSIKESLRVNGVFEDLHGILGVGFFKAAKCFIDYSADRIFILKQGE